MTTPRVVTLAEWERIMAEIDETQGRLTHRLSFGTSDATDVAGRENAT